MQVNAFLKEGQTNAFHLGLLAGDEISRSKRISLKSWLKSWLKSKLWAHGPHEAAFQYIMPRSVGILVILLTYN